MPEPEWITMGEAMSRLGVSKHTMRRIIADNNLETMQNPIDKRERLVVASDIERLRRFRSRPAQEQPTAGKVAA